MYEIPGDEKCPVTSFTKYLSKLNPGNKNFWQRPKTKEYIYPATDIWYDNAAVGKNTLGSMMSNVSDECGLSKRYTNHCIRSTCITALDDGGIETRHIWASVVTNPKESAVRSYTKKLSEKKTRQMSSVLSSTVRSTTTEAIVDQQGTIVTNNVSNAAAGPVSNAPARLDLPVPDFLFDDYELVNALNDITNFETNNNQLPVQNNIQHFTNAPTCNFSGFPSGITINNSTVNFYIQK